MDNKYFWADWYIGYYGLKIESKKAFYHFQEKGFKLKFNPNPLISCWWVQETFAISSYEDFHIHINKARRSHPFFNVETLPEINDIWMYYANNAIEKNINPCAEITLLEILNISWAQNHHFINNFLLLESTYKNFLKVNNLQDNINTRVSFISSL